ncbi:MAG: nucleotide sugar dehydrogenase [Pseudomonadota bacterium]
MDVLTALQSDPYSFSKTRKSNLLRRIKNRDCKICVLGLGYVGLPLTLSLVDAGFSVLGFDTDRMKTKALKAGRATIESIEDAKIAHALQIELLEVTSELSDLSLQDVYIICVPTPLSSHREPDLQFVIAAAEAIAQNLSGDQLVIMESTTYPGTTSEIVKPILESSGLVSDLDFFLAYSPEREDPGNAIASVQTVPKVVGGETKTAQDLAVALYRQVTTPVPVSSTATAEAVKLAENVFRSVNIALVNELKTVFDAMGIDTWEVIDAAKTKPFGYMPFYPGPGVGGHCIPVDPQYLSWKAREFELATDIIDAADRINRSMPNYVVSKLAEELDQRFGHGLCDSHILIVGTAYKPNISDIRESPALKLIDCLERRGALVDFHDPLVGEIKRTDLRDGKCKTLQSVELTESLLNSMNAVVVVTDHSEIAWQSITDHAKLIIDTRGVFSRLAIRDQKIVKA